MKKHTLNPIPLQKVTINGGFWASKLKLVREKVLPYQWRALNDQIEDTEPSHAIENLRIAAGEKQGKYLGMVFQDSDVAKWLEAVGYSLTTQPDPELEKKADEVIDIIAKAQQPDGYMNTYFIVAEPEKRWTNLRDWHELYCAGHLIEGAVAYYQATGKRKILDVLCRYADYIDTLFGPEPEKKKGYPGHEEIELALVKLYRVTGEKRYLNLSKYFIDERGNRPYYYDKEAEERGDTKEYWPLYGYRYNQSHLPVREQTTAEGHSVRAMYLYAGMVDVAAETGDQSLIDACKTLWNNVTQKRMYITGGIGSSGYAEAFTRDYDLPNDTAYTETCASIGLVFFASRMLQIEPSSTYADVMERALYNGVMSGISLDGEKFFYVNPLEVWPETCKVRYDKEHVMVERQKWFGCACCPPNIARLMASIGSYIYSQTKDTLFVHLYAAGTADFEYDGGTAKVTVDTKYPWDEKVSFKIGCTGEQNFTLALRIPGWCRKAEISVNGESLKAEQITENGYAVLRRTWSDGDTVALHLAMPVERVYAHPEIRMNSGKVALQRGPMIYCVEEADNGANIPSIVLNRTSELSARYDETLLGGVTVIEGKAYREATDPKGSELYSTKSPGKTEMTLTAIPYCVWNNRGSGEMQVWIREQ